MISLETIILLLCGNFQRQLKTYCYIWQVLLENNITWIYFAVFLSLIIAKKLTKPSLHSLTKDLRLWRQSLMWNYLLKEVRVWMRKEKGTVHGICQRNLSNWISWFWSESFVGDIFKTFTYIGHKSISSADFIGIIHLFPKWWIKGVI